jgi:hypothetical protein
LTDLEVVGSRSRRDRAGETNVIYFTLYQQPRDRARETVPLELHGSERNAATQTQELPKTDT